jgi:hypothetical protein
VQGNLLDETHARAHQPIELRAIGQGSEGVLQAPSSVAVEVAFAAEAAPPSEKMARVISSLSEREALGPGRFFGGWEWQKSSTMT